MADKDKVQTVEEALKEQNYIPYGSERHQAMIEGAYGMTVAEAKLIVKEWEADHKNYPLDEVKRARAVLAAASAKPVPTSTRPGWKRERMG